LTSICKKPLTAERTNTTSGRSTSQLKPATDVSGAGDSLSFNKSRDVMPPVLSLKLLKQNYLGDADPNVSPIFAEYGPHFPPTVMVTDTRDVMMSGGIRFFWKLEEAKVHDYGGYVARFQLGSRST